ncbi:MAG: hypothetical protein WAS75_16510, partial [Candidatus Microthrix subdominans]
HPVALGELYAGIERAGTSPEREMRTNTLRFTVQRLEQIGEHALPAEQFGFLTSRFGRKLSHNGYWTVATAIAAGGLTLVTEDVKLFDIVTSTQFLEALDERAWLPPPCELVESQAVR